MSCREVKMHSKYKDAIITPVTQQDNPTNTHNIITRSPIPTLQPDHSNSPQIDAQRHLKRLGRRRMTEHTEEYDLLLSCEAADQFC